MRATNNTPNPNKDADLESTLRTSISQANKRKTATKSATEPTKSAARASAASAARKITKSAASAPAPVRTRAPRGMGYQTHEFEHRNEDRTCFACGTPFVHAKGLCSVDYNLGRKLMKQGKTGAALVKGIQERRKAFGLPETVNTQPQRPARRMRKAVAA